MGLNIVLLIALLVGHYLADFCLTTPVMIRAKAGGHNLWPILFHASIHAGLVGVCLLCWHTSWILLLMMMFMELVTHFLIDTAKGLLTSRFPLLADQQKKPHWMLYGFDQLLHILVMVLIWYYCVR